MCSEGVDIVVLQTVCRANIDDVAGMLRFCQDLGVDLLVHPAGIPKPAAAYSELSLELCSQAEVDRLEEVMLLWAGEHEARVKYTHLAMEFIRGRQKTEVRCPMGNQCMFLDVDGSIAPCFHRMDLVCGSVYDDRVPDPFKNASFAGLGEAPCATLACACMLE